MSNSGTELTGMGTKLQYPLNLFPSSLGDNHEATTLGFNIPKTHSTLDSRSNKASFQTGFSKSSETMDKLLEQSKKECVRNTLLMHEEIFKKQVCELHRLYGVQKMLMAELRNKEMKVHSISNTTPTALIDARTAFWSSTSTSETSHSSNVSKRHQSPTLLNSEHSSLHQFNKRRGPSSMDLDICSEDSMQIHKGVDFGQLVVEDKAKELRTIKDDTKTIQGIALKDKTNMDWSDGEIGVDLTLSIGCSADKKTSKHRLHPGTKLGCSDLIHSATKTADFFYAS